MEDRTASFGLWLRRRRRALDLTQEQLADSVSCSRYTIRKIEADERRPSRRLAQRLAQRLDLAPSERDAFLAAARSRPESGDAEPAADGDAADASLPFVGRGDELALLRSLLAGQAAGGGHVVLVEGEPGIGKSRLLREAAAVAAQHRLATLSTRCYEIERAMPYQPVIELAGQAAAQATPAVLQSLPSVSLAEIAALVPEVGERVAVAPPAADFPDARQARLSRALVQLLDALAGGRRLLLMVDDVQWADDASLQFLHYLARQAAARPIVVVYALRDEEAEGHERLASFVNALLAEPHAHRLALGPLDRVATHALVAGSADAALEERLHRETEGNPFFLASMLHALRHDEIGVASDGALALPATLRAAVRARLAHVPPAARPALDLAAVLGRRFEVDTLIAAGGESEERVLQALHALVGRRLLREDASGCHDFAHDKLREAAYLEIGVARRVRLHRAVGEALERAGEDDGRCAEHHERGQAWDKALQCMVRAGDRALRLFAMRDALHWFDRAIALAQAHPQALRETSMVDLHERRGVARAQAGQTDGAVADIGQVIADARARNDRARVRDALIRLGMAYRRADDYASAAETLDEALRECRAMGDERQTADTLYHLGTVAWSNGRNARAIECHAEAVAICERLALRDIVAVQAWHGRGEAHYFDLAPRAAIECFERSIELARGIGDRSYECENLMMVGYACNGSMGVADYARARATLETALGIARDADLQWHVGPILLGLDELRACAGEYGAAWQGMSKTLQWLESAHHTRYRLMAQDFIGGLLLDLGLNERAAGMFEQALALADTAGIRYWRPRLEADLAIAQTRLGRLHSAPRLARALADARRERETTHAVRCLQAQAELALACGDAATSLACAEAWLAAVEAGGLAEQAASAQLARGNALAAQGVRPHAVQALVGAERTARRLGRVRVERDAAHALQRLGERPSSDPAALTRRMQASLAGCDLEGAMAAS